MDIKNPNSYKRGHRSSILLLFILLLVLVATACSSSDSSNDKTEAQNNSVELVEVNDTWPEVSIVVALRTALVDTDRDKLFDLMTSYELTPDVIHLWGVYTAEDGTSGPGTADIVFSVENGKLIAKITAVDVKGLDVDHPRVVNFNQVLADTFTERISSNDIVEISRFEVVSNTVEVTYKTTPE